MGLLFNKKIRLISLLIISSVSFQASAQNGFYVSRGLTISFHFNSIGEIQNGITYTDFGQFRVYNQGTHTDGIRWELRVRANTGFIHALPLEVVEIWANTDVANGVSQGWQQLASTLAPVTLITNGSIGNNMLVDISYRVGDLANPNKVTGYPSDYYSIDLIFEIVFY